MECDDPDNTGVELLAEEVVGKDAAKSLPPSAAQEVMSTDREIIAGEGMKIFEHFAGSPEGRRLCLTGIEPHRDDQGQEVGVIRSSHDVTARRQTEDALEESQRRFQAIFENNLDAMSLMDETLHYVDVNPAMCELLGYSRYELLELTALDNTVEGSPERFPDFLARLRAEGALAGVCSLLCKDGATREVEFRVVANVLPGLHLAVHKDITERRRAEEEVRTLNAALTEVVDGMARLDKQGKLLSANQAFASMLGYQTEELTGLDWRSAVHCKNPERALSIYERMLTDDRAEVELLAARQDGSVFWTQIMFVKIYDRSGHWTGFYCFLKDTTARSEPSAALHKYAKRLKVLSRRVVEVQEEERRHLARELHDEIGQSLTAIGINLNVLRVDSNRELLPRLEECIGIVHNTIDQVRQLSLNLRPAMLDDLGLVAALRWYLHRQAQRVGYLARFLASPLEIPMSPAVATTAFRVAQEALTNVARHARARRVWLWLRIRKTRLSLVVRDDGIGIDSGANGRRPAKPRDLACSV